MNPVNQSASAEVKTSLKQIIEESLFPDSWFKFSLFVLTWPVSAPCIGFWDDERSTGSSRFSYEADEEKDRVGKVEATHVGQAGQRLKDWRKATPAQSFKSSTTVKPVQKIIFAEAPVFLHCANSTRGKVKTTPQKAHINVTMLLHSETNQPYNM